MFHSSGIAISKSPQKASNGRQRKDGGEHAEKDEMGVHVPFAKVSQKPTMEERRKDGMTTCSTYILMGLLLGKGLVLGKGIWGNREMWRVFGEIGKNGGYLGK